MPPQLIADYRIQDEIGSGSTGTLYRAAPPSRLDLDVESVALKVLDKHATDDEYRRFGNEIRLFAAVRSPHLVKLHDAGQQDGTLFYAMEFFEQGSLRTASGNGPPDPELCISAVIDAARGAHALHESGVAHRDIKPSNILLHDEGAKLGDLGLAQVLNPGSVITGTGPIGSIEFMPPTLARGEKAARSTDVWELGATLHKALTGESVYGEIPRVSVLAALRHVLYTPPTISNDIPDPIRACLVRATADEPVDRYPTAAAFADDLEEAL